MTKDRSYLKNQHAFVYDEIFVWNVYQVFENEIKNKNVLDIGAHYGFFTLYSNDLGAKQIIAIEANPITYHTFIKNTKDLLNLKAINAACTSKTGETASIEHNKDSGLNRIHVPENQFKTSVSTLSLADIVEMFPDNEDILLKMDIEGAEHEIFYNTSAEIFKRFNIIVIEIHGPKVHNLKDYSIEQLVEYIKKLNFNLAFKGTFFTEINGKVTPTPEDVITVFKFTRI